MAKKKKLVENESVIQEVSKEEVSITPEKLPEITNYAFSMIENENESFSVIKIGFNPNDKYVSHIIEVVETNTDKFIIQERLSILLLDMEIS